MGVTPLGLKFGGLASFGVATFFFFFFSFFFLYIFSNKNSGEIR